jgi:hypothetical protein
MINGVSEYPMTVDHNGAIGAGSTTPPEIRVVGTAPSDYFGGILGTQEINTQLPFIEQELELLFQELIRMQLAHDGDFCFRDEVAVGPWSLAGKHMHKRLF